MPTAKSQGCPNCGEILSAPGVDCVHCLLDLGSTTLLNDDDIVSDSENPFEQRVFGDYELLGEIARGGMGVVYRARQRSLGRIVALKLILGGQLATRELVHRFRTEAAAAAALHHPNIVAIHEVGIHQGDHFFSMDFVSGQNLAQLVGNHPLHPMKSASYMREIAEAIHFAHEHGILHRDLKPSNVLIDTTADRALVTDFGLAKRLDGGSSLTMTGQVLGSPQFMPPEQADPQRDRVGRRSDVYALGGILYFLLTARPPFLGDSLEIILGQVFDSEPVPPRLLNASVPRDLETICLKCLAKEQNRRYPTAQAVEEDLARFLKGEPTLARPVRQTERIWRWCRRKPAIAGLLASVVFLLLLFGVGSPIVAFNLQQARRIAEANLYSADLNLVQSALAEADISHARQLLDRHRPTLGEIDHRGFEWRYLWRLCQGDEEHVFKPSISFPRDLAFSNDGRLLAAGDWPGHQDRSVVWNLQTRAVEKMLPSGDRPLVFGTDQSLLITGGVNGLKLWDTQTWQSELLGNGHREMGAAILSDRRSLIVYGNGIQLWDITQRQLIRTNDFGQNNFFVHSCLDVSRNGKLLSCARGISYSSASDLRLFHLPSLEIVPWSKNLPADASAVAFHPQNNLIVTGGWSGDIRLWDIDEGKEVSSTMKQFSRVLAMSFCPTNSNLLATTGGDRSIYLWDLSSQKELARLQGGTEEMEALAWSPDGQMIATGGQFNGVMLWNPATTKPDMITVPTGNRNHILGYSDDGARLVTMDSSGQVSYRDSQSLLVSETAVKLDLKLTSSRPQALDFSASAVDFTIVPVDLNQAGTLLALGQSTGSIEVWDLNRRTNSVFKAHTSAIRAVAFNSSVKSRRLVSVCQDGEVRLWDQEAPSSPLARAQLNTVSDGGWPVCVDISAEEDLIAIGSLSELTIFDGTDLRLVHRFKDLGQSMSLRFSPDGRYLVSGNGDGEGLSVRDTRSWEKPQFLPGHDLVPYDLTFSPDGRRLVSGSDKLFVWDTGTWQQLASYKLPIQDISSIKFSPDGSDIVVGDAAALRVWRADSFEEIADQETRLGRWK